jgi:hypothetical protein
MLRDRIDKHGVDYLKSLNKVEGGRDALKARLESPGFDRFMAENGDGDREICETLAEARKYANDAISYWQECASEDGEWSDCVEGVTVWVAIERVGEVGMAKNYPDDADSSDFVLKPLPTQEISR